MEVVKSRIDRLAKKNYDLHSCSSLDFTYNDLRKSMLEHRCLQENQDLKNTGR